MEEQGLAFFESDLHQALNHLDDPCFLRESRLVSLLGLQGDDPEVALRALLEQAIEALKPPPSTALHARRARYHEILLQRYIRRQTQRSVAETLSITPRYLRREQMAAVRALAKYLILRYDLARDRSPGVANDLYGSKVTDLEINREVLWLAESLRGQASDVDSVISEAVELVRDLAQQHGVQCAWSQTGPLPPVCIPRTVLKQVVLNLLTAVMQELPSGGRVDMSGQAGADHAMIRLAAVGESACAWRVAGALDGAIALSRQLAGVFGSDLSLSRSEEMLAIHLTLPYAGRQALVLAVEDNVDTLELWQRYTERTCFRLVAVTNARQAIADAIRLRPDLIVLDIMLPDIDGWELLRGFRTEPATADIPVIVCTVLPQRELALSLGAKDFIPKPATGEVFRAALERQIAAAEPPRSPR